MQRTFVKDLPSLIGQRATVNGFVEAVRDQKRMQFVIGRHITAGVQAIPHKKITT